jgi:Ran GTPase-activating protein (RanGAP) involved in mRNA processing and transport
LASLDLRGNQIGNQGAERLATALEQITVVLKNSALTSLSLAGNQIDPQGAQRLCDISRAQRRLDEPQNLQHNQIGESLHQSETASITRNAIASMMTVCAAV